VTALARLARHVGIAALAGVLTGIVVGGLLGRIAMRVSGLMSRPELIGARTENGNRVGDVTFDGTLGLVVFVGVASGLVGGLCMRRPSRGCGRTAAGASSSARPCSPRSGSP
jgi:hypothetical protein